MNDNNPINNNVLKDHFGFYMRKVNNTKVMPRNKNPQVAQKTKNYQYSRYPKHQPNLEDIISYLNFITTKINDLDFQFNSLKQEIKQIKLKLKNLDATILKPRIINKNNFSENNKKKLQDNLQESIANSKNNFFDFVKKTLK